MGKGLSCLVLYKVASDHLGCELKGITKIGMAMQMRDMWGWLRLDSMVHSLGDCRVVSLGKGLPSSVK